MQSTTNLTSTVDIDIKSNQENVNLRSSMNSNDVVPGATHGSYADIVQQCIGVGPVEQSNVYYSKGDNVELDRKLESYRKLRIWRGDAINQVFDDDEEFQVFGGLWRKERQARKLTVSEVSILIEVSDRIRA